MKAKLSMGKGKLVRWLALALVGSAMVGLVAWAVLDVKVRSESERLLRGDRLRDLGGVANMLFLAEEAKADGLMERLRIELRAQGLWAEPAIIDGVYSTDDDRLAIDGRRLRSILRRALTSTDDIAAFELVVAGHDGLSTVRFEQGTTFDTREPRDPLEQEGFAKALWYAEEVRRAVVSAGRHVERGDLAFETVGDAERPILKLAIGLHDPGELIQGVIVASIDLGGLTRRLESVAAVDTRLVMVTPDGRRLGFSKAMVGAMAGADSRIASLAARVMGNAELPEVFEADGQLVYGLTMAHADGSRANLLALIETEAPPTGVSAWMATPWPISLIVLGLVSALAIWGILRVEGPLQTDLSAVGVGSRDADAASEAKGNTIEIARESFVLRDWLADVRGCLERDAATKGLVLDLRCERSIPVELESDPAWLGGLLVAMGREALEATSSEGIVFEVLEDVGNTLRFEIAAGGVELGPVCGMEEVAGQIGGRFESAREGRVALVLESALAGS